MSSAFGLSKDTTFLFHNVCNTFEINSERRVFYFMSVKGLWWNPYMVYHGDIGLFG